MISSVSEQKQKNPYYPAFDRLLAKLLAAEQALRVSEGTLEHASGSQDEWLTQIPEGDLQGLMGDICDTKNDRYIPSFRWPDSEIEQAICNFRTQSYLWIIARGFEMFRDFVKSIECTLLDTVDIDAEEASTASNETERRSGLDDALKHIRKIAPSLVTCEMKNARKIQLQQWVRVVEKVRNAVAHTEGVLEESTYKEYCTSSLERCFPGDPEPGRGYVLKPTLEVVTKTIVRNAWKLSHSTLGN